MLRTDSVSSLLTSPSKEKWERLGLRRRSGVVVPLFSVYSRESVGIGEFTDLQLVADWCAETGNSILQLLPLNETGGAFCPYDALSSFALEPAYLSLRAIPQADTAALAKRLKEVRSAFPCGRRIDYGIKRLKLKILRDIFKEEYCASAEFRRFREENAYWIEAFALFKALKDFHSGRAWFEWGQEYRDSSSPLVAAFARANEREILFHIWVQWQAYRQLKAARAYAAQKAVLFKGDLPILVSRDSADVWQHPEFFNLGLVAGAPPDMYCAKGQRWGTSTYDWGRIRADGYAYPKEKLRYAQQFYDILRIDHVVGFFRIWSIPFEEPLENQGLNGFFDPREEAQWEPHGRELLSMLLQNTSMLICAEDLGTIPPSCTRALKEFGIPGNDVQRWTKDWKVRHDFLPPQEYRFISVSMLSTHDTTNWPAWWENEAGTVDEALFVRKCKDRLPCEEVKYRLFDPGLSRHGRLRWRPEIDSVQKLVAVMGRPEKELADFIEMYENSFAEKEKLWKGLGLDGPMREKCDPELMRLIFRQNLASDSIFCINTIIDYLYCGDILRGDPYEQRINTPGTVGAHNWSWVMPLSLEELCSHKLNAVLKAMIAEAGRA